MDMADAYEYEPLATERSIRVAEIYPSFCYRAEVKCRLREISLDQDDADCIPFEALSYVWGSSSGRTPIWCDGKLLFVTHNCDLALRRLRRRSSRRIVWIDALCINQEDDWERSQQVSIMGSIYGTANRTIVWLGEGKVVDTLTYHLDRAITTLRDSRVIDERTFDRLRHVPYLLWSWGYRRPDQVEQNPRLRKDWQERVWTVQEFVLAKETIFLRGHQAFPEESMYVNHVVGLHSVHRRLRDEIGLSSQTEPIAAYRSLRLLAQLEASDPRDHIFGAYSVMKHFNVDLPAPDYLQVVEQLFIETTRRALSDCSSMKLLCEKRPSKSTQYNLPSWTIDWSSNHEDTEKSPIIGSVYSQQCFQAAPAAFTMRYKLLPGRQLFLQGIKIGRVNALGDISKEITEAQGGASHHLMVADWAHQVLGEKRRGQDVIIHPNVVEPLDPVMAFYNILDQAHLPQRRLFMCKEKLVRYMIVCFQEYFAWLRRTGISFNLDDIDWSGWPNEQQAKERIAQHLERGSAAIQQASSFASGWSLTGLNFFILKSGYFGLGYRDVSEGDILAIAAGADVPIILRPSDGYYTFMGSAFVPGIMHGEAWKDDLETLETFIII